ncbi:diamine acetyltransferase 2 [Fopius arisanus]|uniref:Diamine acetyltransferase 2 n=1 Tax=Fopius arisanus TaxID=64838 RepID=A0A9R1T1U5_9HYME|nr:PREDICTED: diamine acetyltransferase 2 [Fopius arisanus]
MNGINVRRAVRNDCEGIRKLIQELADFENMSDGPKIGADILEKDGFGDHPLFSCFVAEKNEKLIGYGLVYFIYSTWDGKSMFLEDLYVIPDERRHGIGSLLFDAVIQEAAATNCCRLDFMVLKWNPAANFYKQKGAVDITEKEDWHHYRLDVNASKES